MAISAFWFSTRADDGSYFLLSDASVRVSLSNTSTPPPTPPKSGGSNGSNCSDDTAWVDSEGDNCVAYSLHPDWCASANAFVDDAGVGAWDTCCVCYCESDEIWEDSWGDGCAEYDVHIGWCAILYRFFLLY